MESTGTIPVQLIERGLDMTGVVVGGIPESLWSAPTMCPGWSVRDVLNHTVGGMRIFAALLTGQVPAAEHEADWLADDPRGAYDEAAAADRAAWWQPDALNRTLSLSFGDLPAPMAAVVHLTEVVVHGVDLAVATGREEHLDNDLCQGLLSMMVAMGGIDAYRQPGMFGAEQPCESEAPPHVRLAAYAGRHPEQNACSTAA